MPLQAAPIIMAGVPSFEDFVTQVPNLEALRNQYSNSEYIQRLLRGSIDLSEDRALRVFRSKFPGELGASWRITPPRTNKYRTGVTYGRFPANGEFPFDIGDHWERMTVLQGFLEVFVGPEGPEQRKETVPEGHRIVIPAKSHVEFDAHHPTLYLCEYDLRGFRQKEVVNRLW